MNPHKSEDTIAALSTPPGEGGIGIVRLSGPAAIDIVHGFFRSSRGRDIRLPRGRVFHGTVNDVCGPLDEVLVHVMRAPHSYTAEDVVEINGHGGAGPLQSILELALRNGARLADPGEFTKRAFLNGRIDLVQAEAVIDRIRARTDAALRAATSAASGVLSKTIYELRDVLLDALARIESAIDFPDDDLPELIDAALRERLEGALSRMRDLLGTAEAGRLYREGASVAIAGRPNVGKSSLFNALLRDARAIVTAIPGTTRDLIEEVITIAGVPVRLSDTAGLRVTEDEVERIGIERAHGAASNADCIILVIDALNIDPVEDARIAETVLGLERPAILVINKTDVALRADAPDWSPHFLDTVRLSAKTGDGLKELEACLGRQLLGNARVSSDYGLITRVHQRDSLRRAAESLARLIANYSASPEFLSIDLRESLECLGEITGETTPEDVLDKIFSSFCIGK